MYVAHTDLSWSRTETLSGRLYVRAGFNPVNVTERSVIRLNHNQLIFWFTIAVISRSITTLLSIRNYANATELEWHISGSPPELCGSDVRVSVLHFSHA